MTGRWNRFFFTIEPVCAAVYFRILLAAWTAAFFVPRLPYLEELYTAKAIHSPHPLLELLGGAPVLPLWAVWCVMASFFACLAGFAAGWRQRDLHLLILLHLFYLYGFDTTTLRGYGELSFYQWIILWFAPYDRLREPSGAIVQAPRWGTRLLMMQFCSVYIFTVFAKTVGGDGWFDGRTLYYAFKGQDYGSFLISAWLPLTREAAQVFGLLTLVSELFVAFGLWFRPTRLPAMVICVGMHLTMALSLRVSPLFHVLMVSHLGLFIPPETWTRLLDRRRAPVPLADPLADPLANPPADPLAQPGG